MGIFQGSSFSCYTCTGFSNECSSPSDLGRAEECGALGFDGCVQQTYVSSRHPGEWASAPKKSLCAVSCQEPRDAYLEFLTVIPIHAHPPVITCKYPPPVQSLLLTPPRSRILSLERPPQKIDRRRRLKEKKLIYFFSKSIKYLLFTCLFWHKIFFCSASKENFSLPPLDFWRGPL